MAHFLLIGGTGVGKSSTINALTPRRMAKVGFGSEPQTQSLMGYGASGNVLWDSPGLGDGVDEDMRHISLIKDLITNNNHYRIQHLLLIIEANKRDYGTVYKIIEQIAKPNYDNHISILMNQADQAMKGTHWNSEMNEPSPKLLDFLHEQANSTKERIIKNTGISVSTPIFYSATTGFGITAINEHLQNLSLQYKYGCMHE